MKSLRHRAFQRGRSTSARLATRHFEHPPRGRPVALFLTAIMDLFFTATDGLAGETAETGRLARRFWTTYWTTCADHSDKAT